MFVDEHDQWVRVIFDRPRTIGSIDVRTAQTPPSAAAPDPMHVTRLTAVLSDGSETPVRIADGRGQAVLPATPTDSLELRIDGVGGTDPEPFGIAEVTVKDADGARLRLEEQIQLPDDVIRKSTSSRRLRALLARAPVTYQISRLDRVDDHEVERVIRRRFRTLGTREYTVRGRLADGAAGFERPGRSKPDEAPPAGPTNGAGAPTGDPTACRDIGLTVDREPVLVRATTPGGAIDGCSPLTLGPGWHTLATRRRSGLRRVWLATNPIVAPTPPSNGTTRLTSLGRADFDVRSTTDAPAAIISGQSFDDGWSATLDGRDAGGAMSLDTQAAWEVGRAGAHHLVGHQDEQGPYRVALVVTAFGLLLCGFLVIRGRFR